MDLFEKHSGVLARHAKVTATGADPFAVCMDEVLSPTEAIINGSGRYAVASLDEIIPADSADAEDALEIIRGQMQRSVQGIRLTGRPAQFSDERVVGKCQVNVKMVEVQSFESPDLFVREIIDFARHLHAKSWEN